MSEHPREITREKKTIDAIVHIYCKDHHEPQKGELCPECSKFMEYAKTRLDKCPFQEKKSTLRKMPDPLLSAFDERASEDCYAVFGSTNASAPSGFSYASYS